MSKSSVFYEPADILPEDIQANTISKELEGTNNLGKLLKLKAEQAGLEAHQPVDYFDEMDVLNRLDIVNELLDELTNG